MSLPERTPRRARVVANLPESASIFTLRLELPDDGDAAYRFQPGQFNMLYLFGGGEIPLSISGASTQPGYLDHTIRRVGRISERLAAMRPGQELGLRGPYGRGWPLAAARGRPLLVITGGLGCAPSVAMIRHIIEQRPHYGPLTLIQGVRHADDMIWRDQYRRWASADRVTVRLAADQGGPAWPWHTGLVTELIEPEMLAARPLAMICGPEMMMCAAIRRLLEYGLGEADIWLSMERNMHCGVGLCGHCQIGPHFVCRDGPVFPYPQIKDYLQHDGF
jgi:sulfhydrogenase subunit gamma (sulfur reductase)